jgi:hypothetical protein
MHGQSCPACGASCVDWRAKNQHIRHHLELDKLYRALGIDPGTDPEMTSDHAQMWQGWAVGMTALAIILAIILIAVLIIVLLCGTQQEDHSMPIVPLPRWPGRGIDVPNTITDRQAQALGSRYARRGPHPFSSKSVRQRKAMQAQRGKADQS